jgi:hypothetical protein
VALERGAEHGGNNVRPVQTTPKDIDEYIASFPQDIQAILEQIRATIKKAAPDAEEAIAYQMPTFKRLGDADHRSTGRSPYVRRLLY